MKWKNTRFQYQDIAELCHKELDEAGIKVGKIFLMADTIMFHGCL